MKFCFWKINNNYLGQFLRGTHFPVLLSRKNPDSLSQIQSSMTHVCKNEIFQLWCKIDNDNNWAIMELQNLNNLSNSMVRKNWQIERSTILKKKVTKRNELCWKMVCEKTYNLFAHFRGVGIIARSFTSRSTRGKNFIALADFWWTHWGRNTEIRSLVSQISFFTLTAITGALLQIGNSRHYYLIIIRKNAHFYWYICFLTADARQLDKSGVPQDPSQILPQLPSCSFGPQANVFFAAGEKNAVFVRTWL